jgi:O-antigen biosynthesis protein
VSEERLIPEEHAGEVVVAEHLARYRLAARLAPGCRVLDAACGDGYGTAMLAAAGAVAALGVDLSEETVARAREKHGIEAAAGDVTALPFDDGAFDLVVSFETIEHVADPLRALSELARVTAPDGALLVSTPNPREYLDENPFHVRELDPDEFLAALRERFATVRPLYQQNFLASAVLDEGRLGAEGDLALDTAKIAAVVPGRELYTLALCSHAVEAPALEADVAVLAGVWEAWRMARDLREWPERAAEAERLVETWTARAEEAERLVATWEARATEAEHVQGEWEARAVEAERVQVEWQARAAEAERQNEELRATLQRISESVSWKVTKPLRAVRRRGG